MHYLKHNFSLNDALSDIVKKGGNIMGNATIVGGLIGASVGVKAFDKGLVQKVLTVK
jgi:ADP-ribosylglycohydrolase